MFGLSGFGAEKESRFLTRPSARFGMTEFERGFGRRPIAEARSPATSAPLNFLAEGLVRSRNILPALAFLLLLAALLSCASTG